MDSDANKLYRWPMDKTTAPDGVEDELRPIVTVV